MWIIFELTLKGAWVAEIIKDNWWEDSHRKIKNRVNCLEGIDKWVRQRKVDTVEINFEVK